MKSTVVFAIFGFLAALVQSFGQEQGIAETLRSGLGWGAVFGVLGWGIGRAARAIAREAIPGETNDQGAPPGPETWKHVERAWVRPSERETEAPTPPSSAPRSREREPDEQRV